MPSGEKVNTVPAVEDDQPPMPYYHGEKNTLGAMLMGSTRVETHFQVQHAGLDEAEDGPRQANFWRHKVGLAFQFVGLH